jgi:signal transduction histidine kinase
MSSTFTALHVPLFDGLADDGKASLFAVASQRTCRDGEVIISEGEEGDALFVVMSGAVQVEKATLDRRQEALVSLREGECFGELTLVDRQPRSATVRALGDTEVCIFQRDALDSVFARNPDVQRVVLGNLVRIMAGRLRRVDENLIQSLYDSVIVVDRNLCVTEWNRASRRWSFVAQDVPTEQLIGRNLFELLPHLRGQFRERIEAVTQQGQTLRFQVEYESENGGQVRVDSVTTSQDGDGPEGATGSAGGRVYVETIVAPYRRGDQIVGAVIANRDVTDVKSLERQLIQAEKMAMAGQMAADIGHELNNYLSIISGHADILSLTPELKVFPRVVKSLETISEQVRRIERFTASLMDFSAQNTKRQPANLNDLIVQLVRFIQPQHRYRDVKFTLCLADRLPFVEIDSGQVQQILLNLYANAADAMKSGLVTTVTRLREADGKVILTVSDNGPGMPPRVLSRIFEVGFTTKRTGHGFGLSICKRIMDNHGGDIAAQSEVGKGTTFTLTLPAAGHAG